MKKIKIIIITLSLLLFAQISSAFAPNLKNMRIQFQDTQGSFFENINGNDVFRGWLSCIPNTEYKKIPHSIKNGEIIVDTREYYKNGSGGKNFYMGFWGVDLKEAIVLKKGQASGTGRNVISFDGVASVPNSAAALFFEGETLDANGAKQHFLKGIDLILDPELQHYKMEIELPSNIVSIHFRIDLKSPAVFKITNPKFTTYNIEKKKYDSSKNYIVNGGAEAEWHQIYNSPLYLKQDSIRGTFIDWFLREISHTTKFELDSNIKKSGKYAFKLIADAPMADDSLIFAPVPFAVGEPTSFSAYIRSDKPSQKAVLTLTLASGIAYTKPVFVTDKWERYEIFTPSFGAPEPALFGDAINGYANPAGVLTPTISLGHEQGTIWVDDASYTIGGKSQFDNTPEISLTGVFENSKRYYTVGEPVDLKLILNSNINKAHVAKINGAIYDVFGKCIATLDQKTDVKIDANGRTVTPISINLPKTLRGPFNVKFEAEIDNGKVVDCVLFAGVIDKAKPFNRRLGVEVCGATNLEVLIPYLKDFRYGIARVGGASGRMEEAFLLAKLLHKADIKVLLTAHMDDKYRDNPATMKDWTKEWTKLAKDHAGMIEYYETQNEANIHSWTVDNNYQMLQALCNAVKAGDPNAKIAGPTTCATDFTWIGAILEKGGYKLLDAVTEHPYRQLPEAPDYATDVRAMRKLINLYDSKIKHFATESGRVLPLTYPGKGWIDEYSRLASARDIRNMLQAFGNGINRYYHFTGATWEISTGWHIMSPGSLSGDGSPVPYVAAYAQRNLIDRLEDAPTAGRVKLGTAYRCYIFDHGDRRTAVLWKWKGEVAEMTFNKSASKDFKIYDFVGNPLANDKLAIGEYPIYIDSKLTASDLSRTISHADLIDKNSKSIEIHPAVVGANKIAIKVKNITSKPISVMVAINKKQVVGKNVFVLKNIGAESTKEAVINLPAAISVDAKMLNVSVKTMNDNKVTKLEVPLQAILVNRAKKPLVIDGKLDDWKGAVAIPLTSKNDFIKELSLHNFSASQAPYDATLRYMWDEDYLYFSAEVFKDTLYPVKSMKESDSIYMYDSIQFCFDPMRNATKEQTFFSDDDFQYSFGARLDGAPLVYRRYASSAVYDSLAKKQGVIDEVKIAVHKYSDRTVYETAFPRRAVSPFKLTEGSMMRSSAIININDGEKRVGYLELTPGIGQDKQPGLWMDTVLIP